MKLPFGAHVLVGGYSRASPANTDMPGQCQCPNREDKCSPKSCLHHHLLGVPKSDELLSHSPHLLKSETPEPSKGLWPLEGDLQIRAHPVDSNVTSYSNRDSVIQETLLCLTLKVRIWQRYLNNLTKAQVYLTVCLRGEVRGQGRSGIGGKGTPLRPPGSRGLPECSMFSRYHLLQTSPSVSPQETSPSLTDRKPRPIRFHHLP